MLTDKKVWLGALLAVALIAVGNRFPVTRDLISGDDKFLGIF